MSCKEIKVLLSARIDCEISEQEFTITEKHLSECEDCQRYYQNLKLISAVYSDVPEQEPPENLVEEIRKATTKNKKVVSFPASNKKSDSIALKWKQLAAGLAIFFISLSVGIVPLLTHNLALDSPFELIDYSFQESFIEDELEEDEELKNQEIKPVEMESYSSRSAVASVESSEASDQSTNNMKAQNNQIMEFSVEEDSSQNELEENNEEGILDLVGGTNTLITLSGSILGIYLIIKAKK